MLKDSYKQTHYLDTKILQYKDFFVIQKVIKFQNKVQTNLNRQWKPINQNNIKVKLK